MSAIDPSGSGSETDDSVDGHTSPVPRGRRSKVWEHFEPNLINGDADLKAICKCCQIQLHTKSGTSPLRSHITEYCPAIPDDVRERFVGTMTNRHPPGGLLVFDPEICYDRMIEYCIHAEIPFLQWEDPYCQPWVDSMQPTFKVKKRMTIRKGCLSNVDQIEIRMNSALKWFREYYSEYEQQVKAIGAQHVSTSSSEITSVGSPVLGKRQIEEEFAQYKSRQRGKRPSYKV